MKKVVTTLFVLAALCAQLVQANTDWPYLKLTRVGSKAGAFTGLIDAGDGSGRLFAVEQPGRIWIIQSNEFLNSPLLDITNKVTSIGEEGLLSAAFPPGSGPKTNFYVCYTRKPDNVVVVSRFRIGADTNHVDPATEEVLLTLPTQADEHYGGQLAFGPDGYLYIGRGDSDAGAAGMSGTNYFGKILRISVEGVSGGYVIPSDNPFVSTTNFLPEIWALGLRNPWRFSFDRLTGDLYIADVGASSREEVDRQPAGVGGQNYGWPAKEGSLDLQSIPGVNPAQFTPPIFEYGHTGQLRLRHRWIRFSGIVRTIERNLFVRGLLWRCVWIKTIRHQLGTISLPAHAGIQFDFLWRGSIGTALSPCGWNLSHR